MGLVMSVSDQVVALEFRPQDRRRHARRGAQQSGRDRGLSGDATLMAPILELHAPQGLLRPVGSRARDRLRGRGRRHDGAARRQWRGQDDDAARHLRHGPHARARSASPASSIERPHDRGDRRAAASPTCRTGAAPSSALTVEENLRLGAYTRAATGARRGHRARVRLFPDPRRAPPPAGRHAVGRRAADAGDRPRADAGAAPPAAGRAVVRPGAADRARRSSTSCDRINARGARERPAGRAERQPGAGARRPRLRARDRPCRHLGKRRRRSRDDPQIRRSYLGY